MSRTWTRCSTGRCRREPPRSGRSRTSTTGTGRDSSRTRSVTAGACSPTSRMCPPRRYSGAWLPREAKAARELPLLLAALSFGAFDVPGGIRSLSPHFARRLLLPPGPRSLFPTSSAPSGRSTCQGGFAACRLTSLGGCYSPLDPLAFPHIVRPFGAFDVPGGIRSLSPHFARRLLLPPGPPSRVGDPRHEEHGAGRPVPDQQVEGPVDHHLDLREAAERHRPHDHGRGGGSLDA